MSTRLRINSANDFEKKFISCVLIVYVARLCKMLEIIEILK